MDRLAAVCEQIASHNSRLKKIALLSEYLRGLSDEDLALAVQFLSEGPVGQTASLFDNAEKSNLSIGFSTLRAALQAATGWDTQTLRVCHAAVGDTGETASLLLRGIGAGQPLTLQRANEIYQELFRARTTAARRDLLTQTFRTYRPLAIKYFVKIVTRSLRIGLTTKMVEEARRTDTSDDSKPPYGTLAVVITSAERGALYTVAVRSGESFVNVGKAYSVLTDTEMKALTRIVRSASTDKFGPVTVVRPQIVLEVAFDGVQKSARHKSGYALRFPRILRWRRDKKPEECDDLARVEALYQASLE